MSKSLDIWNWQKQGRRPTWDEVFMIHAEVAATRSTCDRGPGQRFSDHKGVGACIVSPDNRNISLGYSGSPPGTDHCDDKDHIMVDGSCVRTIHAEENAILNSSFSLKGCRIYTTAFPCYNCSKRIIAAGIVEVIWQYAHKLDRIPSGSQLLCDSHISMRKLEMDII